MVVASYLCNHQSNLHNSLYSRNAHHKKMIDLFTFFTRPCLYPFRYQSTSTEKTSRRVVTNVLNNKRQWWIKKFACVAFNWLCSDFPFLLQHRLWHIHQQTRAVDWFFFSLYLAMQTLKQAGSRRWCIIIYLNNVKNVWNATERER